MGVVSGLRIRAGAAAAAAVLLVLAPACATEETPPAGSPPPSTSVGVPVVDSIDVPGSRAAMERGQAAIRAILERELGPDGWTEDRPAQENASSSCGGVGGVGKFYAAETSHPGVLEGEQWERVWTEIVRAVEPVGFRPEEGSGPGSETAPTFVYLINEHRDELTVSSQPGLGTGYGGFSVCHPWGP